MNRAAVRAVSKWCQIGVFYVYSKNDAVCLSVQKKPLLPAKVTIEEGYSVDPTVNENKGVSRQE